LELAFQIVTENTADSAASLTNRIIAIVKNNEKLTYNNTNTSVMVAQMFDSNNNRKSMSISYSRS